MGEKIRICLVGAGFIGKKHAEAFSQQKEAKLQVICDKNKDLAKQLADEYNFERIETDFYKAVQAEDVDLVCVCVPNNMHYSIVSEAIKSGKHISCEKPLGMNKNESEDLCKQVKEKGIIANCCYNLIYVPAIKHVHKIIQSGILGDVVCFRGTYDNDRLANPEEKFEKVKFEENEIKKLNNWDIQHAFKDKNAFRSQSFTKIAQSLDPSSLKWMFEIKQDPKKLQNLNRIPKLKVGLVISTISLAIIFQLIFIERKKKVTRK